MWETSLVGVEKRQDARSGKECIIQFLEAAPPNKFREKVLGAAAILERRGVVDPISFLLPRRNHKTPSPSHILIWHPGCLQCP